MEYIGNPDFRGWLAADPNKSWALDYVGNDPDWQSGGGINYDAIKSLSEGAGAVKSASGQWYNPDIQNLPDIFRGYWNTYSSPGGQTSSASTSSGPTLTDFMNQKANVYGTAREAAGSSGRELGLGIQDYIDSLRSGQQAIDNSAINNILAKEQAAQGILGMVGRGIRSGGVMLANRNAGDSSAAGAIARAYGDIGRREMSNVGNQYEMKNRDIGLQQQNLETQRLSGSRRLAGSKQSAIDNIVNQARQSLAQLDAAMADASMSQRINIEQEKEAIKSQVSQALSQYDAQIAGGNEIQPSSFMDRRSQAQQLLRAGTDLGQDAFNFTDQVPAQFQGTGPFSSDLPLFLASRRKRS